LSDLHKRGIHHVMVEGGPATALIFLQQETVDRAILIRAPIQFSKPVESKMSMDTLENAGLQLLGTATSDGDVVEYWSRVGVPWPTDELTDWP
jgi:riboflavin biosynthesis pyrimidine reductase